MGILSSAPLITTLDAASIARLAALANAAPIMIGFYTAAMRASVAQVQRAAMLHAPVQYGTLRRGIQGHVVSPWEGVVGVIDSVPYARRREFGFDLQTDALGRYYPLDPADPAKREHMHYLENGLNDSRAFIDAAYVAAVGSALRVIAL